MNSIQINLVVEKINYYYKTFGQSTYEEACTQQSHGEQCGTFALLQGLDMEVAIAAFLHDIGHFIAEEQEHSDFNAFGFAKHSELGADFLEQNGFSKRIVRMVKFHVQAKRYLSATKEGYVQNLSTASLETLSQQGCSMSRDEIEYFEQNSDFSDLLKLRELDDLGKQTSMNVQPLNYWLKACREHLSEQHKLKSENNEN